MSGNGFEVSIVGALIKMKDLILYRSWLFNQIRQLMTQLLMLQT
jgi:hypothetical protein